MERGDYTMKKILTHIFFVAAMLVGFSVTASAQQDGKKARPPKEPPPVIVPGKKPDPKDEKPKEPKDEKNKKPEATIFYLRHE